MSLENAELMFDSFVFHILPFKSKVILDTPEKAYHQVKNGVVECLKPHFFLAHLSTKYRTSSVNNFFKHLLLQNQRANLHETWQECSLGEALPKVFK